VVKPGALAIDRPPSLLSAGLQVGVDDVSLGESVVELDGLLA
jgi:hypothetical protein